MCDMHQTLVSDTSVTAKEKQVPILQLKIDSLLPLSNFSSISLLYDGRAFDETQKMTERDQTFYRELKFL